jgi:hypothetical protein
MFVFSAILVVVQQRDSSVTAVWLLLQVALLLQGNFRSAFIVVVVSMTAVWQLLQVTLLLQVHFRMSQVTWVQQHTVACCHNHTHLLCCTFFWQSYNDTSCAAFCLHCLHCCVLFQPLQWGYVSMATMLSHMLCCCLQPLQGGYAFLWWTHSGKGKLCRDTSDILSPVHLMASRAVTHDCNYAT